MRATTAITLAIQVLLIGTAAMLGRWAGMPWVGVAGLLAVGAGVVCTTAAGGALPARAARACLSAAWAGTLLVAVAALAANGARATFTSYFDGYYLILGWAVAAAILPVTALRVTVLAQGRWRALAMAWTLMGAVAWLGAAYLENSLSAFLLGLLILLVLLASCHFWFRLGAAAIVTVNTLILLVVAIPVADVALRGVDSLAGGPDPSRHYYLYDVARDHPVAFGRWWSYYRARWRELERRIYAHDPDPKLTYRLRPNSEAQLAHSTISINSLGFRGPEIPRKKGNTYRIVALGASTTFGVTLFAGELSWPRRLEHLIEERLKPQRPVEVINAGVPGYRLDQSLHRLATDILPLKPDLIISYCGINNFGMLRGTVPRLPGAAPPRYRERPLRLLADFEYRLKLMAFDPHPMPRPTARQKPLADPMTTPYARLYRKLIQITETNQIRLAVATFSMAATPRSDSDVIEFYQAGYPKAPWEVQANVVHTRIVQQLAREHPEVCFVDTHTNLDGEPDKFIDLVHFSPAGKAQMAETFFAALKPILEQDLSGF